MEAGGVPQSGDGGRRQSRYPLLRPMLLPIKSASCVCYFQILEYLVPLKKFDHKATFLADHYVLLGVRVDFHHDPR